MYTTEFEVNGLTTPSDADRLAQSLATLDGVARAHVRWQTGTVILVSHSHAASGAQARTVARLAGYEVASDFVAPPQRQARPRFRLTRLAHAVQA